MIFDLDKLQLDLEYGQVVNFDKKYYVLKFSDENLKKYKKIIQGAEISIPVFLLKFHNIKIQTSKTFLKFKITKNPKNIQNLFDQKKIAQYIDMGSSTNLDKSEEKLISIFKKFNLLPFIIFINKNEFNASHSFNITKTLKSLNQSRISYRNSAFLPLKKNDDVKILLFDDLTLKTTHYAIVFNEKIKSKVVNVRIHSSCLTGDLLGSQRCDCGYQLNTAIDYISSKKQKGIIVYLNQEGRGLGIHNKIISYNIQENGWNTYEADNILGFSGDERDYKSAVKILKYLKTEKVNLITNNPDKTSYLNKNDIKVSKTIKIKPGINKFNKNYLHTKKTIGKHLINL